MGITVNNIFVIQIFFSNEIKNSESLLIVHSQKSTEYSSVDKTNHQEFFFCKITRSGNKLQALTTVILELLVPSSSESQSELQ